ncbi:hypothetical protein WA026_005101 [Henosepilachna vigintioctopunctata]|uniref:Clip domain-containing protein n=1 Tax=Henosepilachna vigintioctopunctata TaxID=420089 RepID=A0AAW1UW18_9CUCU
MFLIRRLFKHTIWIILFYIASADKDCGQNMECIKLQDCQQYTSYVQNHTKSLNPIFVRFLRANHCGFENRLPKVCCGAIPALLLNFDNIENTEHKIKKKDNLSTIRKGELKKPKTHNKVKRPISLDKINKNLLSQISNFYRTEFFGPFDLLIRKRRFQTNEKNA